MISILRNFFKKLISNDVSKVLSEQEKIAQYKSFGSIPWSEGYIECKWELINKSINDNEILNQFSTEILPYGYGKSIDERVIEYPWLISHLQNGKSNFLDAGSTFNFKTLLEHPVLNEKDIYIYTYFPEQNNFLDKRVSYIYGDLRSLPFKDEFFETVVCHSTLEHIDMDNSMYGYTLEQSNNKNKKSYEYLKVINELVRVTQTGGKILLTFPYGIFENHGFFQQFDAEMVDKIEIGIQSLAEVRKSFAKYEETGWIFTSQTECNDAVSYNPHTGKGKGLDNAAHSRSICFMEIVKY